MEGSLKGRLLAASPALEDPNFIRAVILMVEHGPNGALGVVLNRPTDKTVGELWREVGAPTCASQQPVYLGGPVSGPLLSLHTNRSLAEIEVLPEVYLSAKRECLDALAREDDEWVKIFVGHSGWGGGQLERELEEGAWLVADANKSLVFEGQEDLWEKVCQQIGDDVFRGALGIRDFPEDPSAN